jgi:glycosyltransferase involved in cell wall biosynthesis
MRIGISTSSLGRGGGMERYARDIIEGFLAAGIETTAICRKTRGVIPGCAVRRIPCTFIPGKLRDRYFSFRVSRLKKRLGIDIHIACCLDANPDVAICGGTHIGFLAALGRAPGLFDRLKIRMERSQYRNAGLIIAHSRMMRDELASLYGVPEKKIHIVYPPVDKTNFKPLSPDERRDARKRLGFADGRFALLFPSGSHERKGLPFLKRFLAATKLPVDVHVAGRRAEEEDNIRNLGYIDDMRLAYGAADATILASGYEPFGLVGVESLLCGTPVVYADNIGSCEVLRPPALATFSLNDAASLEKAVAGVMALDRDVLASPERYLNYDCGVAAHVTAIRGLLAGVLEK